MGHHRLGWPPPTIGAVIDPVLCADCGTCIERCEVGAITAGFGSTVVDRTRHRLRTLLSGCPNEVARLERKPAVEIVHPPATHAEWEQ